jgi:hypothetical protein
MLPPGQLGKPPPGRSWMMIVADSATFVIHPLSVAPGVLRVGDLCNETAQAARGP